MTWLLIYLSIIIAVTLFLLALRSIIQPKVKHIPLPPQEEGLRKRGNIQPLAIMTLPFAQKFLEKTKLEGKLKKRLDAAHLKLTPTVFFNIKLLLMILFSGLVYLASGKADILAFSLPLIAGYILPDLWLNIKISQRRQAIVYFLPETVDLIGLCVEAGLDFTAALKWVVEKTPINPMSAELSLVLDEIKWGKARSQALKDMAKRSNLAELNSFVQTLVQAERMGTPVAEAFRLISEDTRELRFRRGERLALKAPLKILIPLIFFILPVIAIIVGGPLILQFTQGDILKGLGP